LHTLIQKRTEQKSWRVCESGKHVLCEKPIAISLEGAQKMLDAAKKSGKILMIVTIKD